MHPVEWKSVLYCDYIYSECTRHSTSNPEIGDVLLLHRQAAPQAADVHPLIGGKNDKLVTVPPFETTFNDQKYPFHSKER